LKNRKLETYKLIFNPDGTVEAVKKTSDKAELRILGPGEEEDIICKRKARKPWAIVRDVNGSQLHF
jgi:hypothetical protein